MKSSTTARISARRSARIEFVAADHPVAQADALVLFAPKTRASISLPTAPNHTPTLRDMLRAVRAGDEFSGKLCETILLPTWGKLPWKKIILAGTGPEPEISRAKLSRAAGAAARAADKRHCKSIVIHLPVSARPALDIAAQTQAVIEGIILGLYRFDQFMSNDDPQPASLRAVTVTVQRSMIAAAQAAAKVGALVAEATNYARDIANLPGNVIYPATLADEAVRLARQFRLEADVWTPARLEREKFGGILAVGAGSNRPPRFIRLDYRPRRVVKQPPIVLVGKAITFDSGGISIKQADKMDEMKYDKSGGVAVLGALRAAAALEAPVPVTGLIAAAENMPGASSYRPGDIVRALSGVTIEVQNTDAEGRIVLSDALAYAARLKPQAIIDMATLTGACVVALGGLAAGLFTSHAGLETRIREAGDLADERVWPLPLWEEYREKIKSGVADIKNTGGREGGAITAACFLEKFVGKTPWAHIDIAGTAWTTEDKPHLARGCTGFGVRLIAELLRAWRAL